MLIMKIFLDKIDIYGEEIKLTINSKEKINSSFGGIFTIFTIIFIILFSWFIGNDIIYKVQPLSYLDFAISEEYPILPMKNDFFPFAFCITDIAGKPFKNESLLTFEFVKNDFKYNEKSGILEMTNTKQIKLLQCNKSHFPTISDNQFSSAALETYFCPELNNQSVQGYWSQSSLTYFSFSVKKCNYDLYPNKCDTKENIEKTISSLALNHNFITIENIVSVGNYEQPILPTILMSYKFLHYENLKITNFMIQKNILFTDNGFFSTSQYETEFSKLVELQTDLIKIDNDTKEMAQMNFYSSNRSEYFYRKYIKVTDILASVGGLVEVLMIFFSIIIKPNLLREKTKILFNYIKSYEVGEDFIKNFNSKIVYNFKTSKIKDILKNSFEKNFYNNKNLISKLKKDKLNSKKNDSNKHIYLNNNFFIDKIEEFEKNQTSEKNFTSNLVNVKLDNDNPQELSDKIKINYGHDIVLNTHNFSSINFNKKILMKHEEILEMKIFKIYLGLLCKFICPNKKTGRKYKNLVCLNKYLISLLDVNNLLLKIIELEFQKKHNLDN